MIFRPRPADPGITRIEFCLRRALLGRMYQRFLRAILLAALLFAGSDAARALEPANIFPHKQELRAYIDSGEYAKNIAEVALSANKYLVKRIARGSKRKMAVVFDIDETILSNLSQILSHDFGYVQNDWNVWVAAGRAPAIIPVQTIYDTAVRGKIAIFFITGRSEADRAGTEHNLRDVGYDTWTQIFFRPATDDKDATVRGFKIDTRRKLEEQGYTIVANIGDQNSDLVGGYAERYFKLPNPFYLTR